MSDPDKPDDDAPAPAKPARVEQTIGPNGVENRSNPPPK